MTTGEGSHGVDYAIGQGAKTLDCYAGYLRDYYERHGFKETGRMKFDDEQAPPDWDKKDGQPDVVFMAYQGGPRHTIHERINGFEPHSEHDKYHTNWTEAKDESRAAAMA